jgi:hypothetical protein
MVHSGRMMNTNFLGDMCVGVFSGNYGYKDVSLFANVGQDGTI